MNNDLNYFRKPLKLRKIEIEEVIAYLSSFINRDPILGDHVSVFYLNPKNYEVWVSLHTLAGCKVGYSEIKVIISGKIGNIVKQKNTKVGAFENIDELKAIFKKIGVRKYDEN